MHPCQPLDVSSLHTATSTQDAEFDNVVAHPDEWRVWLEFRKDRAYKDERRRLLEAFECIYLGSLLDRHDGNISAASRASELSRKHLRTLIKKYDLLARCRPR